MHHNPKNKLKRILYAEEQRVIRSLLDILENIFGFNFFINDGHVVEVQLIAAGLAVIPRQLRRLPYLSKLQVPSNKIRRLRNLAALENLQVINISDNKLTTNGLKKLHLCNQISSIDCSLNRINSLIPFSGLENLEVLNISDNEIDKIEVIDTPSLTHLDLTGNPIMNLENIDQFDNLVNLKIKSSQLSDDEKQLISENDISKIKEYLRRN